jgi:hypothetical protein
VADSFVFRAPEESCYLFIERSWPRGCARTSPHTSTLWTASSHTFDLVLRGKRELCLEQFPHGKFVDTCFECSQHLNCVSIFGETLSPQTLAGVSLSARVRYASRHTAHIQAITTSSTLQFCALRILLTVLLLYFVILLLPEVQILRLSYS